MKRKYFKIITAPSRAKFEKALQKFISDPKYKDHVYSVEGFSLCYKFGKPIFACLINHNKK